MRKYLVLIALLISGAAWAQPNISSFSPTAAGTGMNITITGSNFTGIISVTLGGMAASSFTVLSSTTIVAVVASGTSGNVAVSDGTTIANLAGFVFLPAPTISAATPLTGTTGTVISITGTNFISVTDVSFNNTAAASFTVLSPTTISAIVANGSTGLISVSTAGGRATFSSFTFISAGPSITSFSPVSGNPGTVVTITGTNFTGVTGVSFGGTAASSFTVLSATTITGVVGTGSSGSISITTGGGTAAMSGFSFSYLTPSITSFTPGSGKTGAVITITGANFTGATAVTIGGAVATSFTIVSSTSIQASVGNGASGSVNITTPGGIASKTGFAYIGVPAISSFSPLTGTTGTILTIIGSNLNVLSSVTIGGISASAFTSLSSTQATAVVSTGASGAITVTNAAGSASIAGFTFITIPTIASFSPLTGTSGTVITIAGTNFTGTTAVSVGGTAAISFTVTSSTSISAVVGAGTSGSISVTTNGYNTSITGFTFVPVPTISSFSPLTGTTGTNVTITGTYLSATTAVSFGGMTAAAFTIVSPTTIIATVGTGATGSISLTASGYSTERRTFTYIFPPPTILSFSPKNVYPGTAVIITGTNLSETTAITFGGNAVSAFTVLSPTTVVAIANNGAAGNINLVTTGGNVLASGVTFSYPPHIDSLSTISVLPGKQLIIYGSNFDSTVANNIVRFKTVPAKIISASANKLVVTVPTGAAYGQVSVIIKGMTCYSKESFIPTFVNTGPAYPSSLYSINKTFRTKSMPFTPIIVDMNNDGRPDIICNGTVDNGYNIVVYKNAATNSDGTISISDSAVISLTRAGYLYWGDLDGDGLPELIATYDSTNAPIEIYPNTSKGDKISFGNKITLPGFEGGIQPTAYVVDVDNDGRNDLIINKSQAKSGGLAIYRNLGTGTGDFSFATRVEVVPSSNATSDLERMTFGDFNNDGKPDLVFTKTFSSEMAVLRNTSIPGVISFASRSTISSKKTPYHVKTGDMDGDGKADLLVYSSDSTLCFFRNTTIPGSDTITFATRQDKSVGVDFFGLWIADMNGDSKPDIVFRGAGVSVYYNTSKKDSISVTESRAGLTPAGYASGDSQFDVGDLDDDGIPEIIVADDFLHAIQIWKSNAQPGGITTPPTISSFTPAKGSIGSSVTISGTGFNALASNNFVYFGGVKASITSATTSTITVTVPTGTSHDLLTVTSGGLTAYSKAPFLVTFPSYFSDKKLVTGAFANPIEINTNGPANYSDMITCDFDNDGKPDIAYADSTIAYKRNTSIIGKVSFAAESRKSGATAYPRALAYGDLDGDGKQDLAAVCGGYISLFRNLSTSGSITFDSKVDLYYPGSSIYTIAIRDIDLDGKPDLVITSDLKRISVFRNTSSTGILSFAPPADFGTVAKPGALLLKDLDGDGKTDIVSYSVDSALMFIFRNTGTAGSVSFSQQPTIVATTQNNKISAEDLDGDGLPELAVGAQGYPGGFFIFKNTSSSGSIAFSPAAKYYAMGANAGQSPNFADLNGDGRTDVYVGGAGPNFIGVRRNYSTNTSSIDFDSAVNYIPGNNAHIKTAACDLDGDGRLDLIMANFGIPSVSIMRNVMPETKMYSFSPVSGKTGDTINVKGINFLGAASGVLGNTLPGYFTVVSDTLVRMVVGAGASSGLVRVNGLLVADSLAGFIFLLPNPTIKVSTTPGDFILGTTLNIPKVDYYYVSAVELIAPLLITGTDKFTVSTSATTGFGTSVSITPANGAIDSVRIYVRFAADAAGSFSGDITHTSKDAATQVLTVKGSTTCDAVSNQKASFNGLKSDTSICFKNNITLTADGNYAFYKWNTGETTQSISVQSTKSISLQVGNSPACLSLNSITAKVINNTNPVPSITVSADTRLTSSAALNYRWYYNNKLLSNVSTSSIDATKIGFYKVETSLDRVCWNESAEVAMVINAAPLVNDTLKLTLYPNPALSGSVFYVVGTMQKPTNVIAKLIIVNVSGNNIVQSSRLIFFGKEIKIPVTLTDKGSYFIRLDVNGDIKTQTIIIQ